MDRVKQVIVMRTDLNMRKGKMIAQGSHASMMFMSKSIIYADDSLENYNEICLYPIEEEWLRGKFTKICLQVNSEEELMDVYNTAKEQNLTVHLVEDEGLTEFHGKKTKTCLAIGPDYSSLIDPITNHLKLL